MFGNFGNNLKIYNNEKWHCWDSKKHCKSIIEIIQKMKKFYKEIMVAIEIKICQIWIEKEKKEYEELYKKKLSN